MSIHSLSITELDFSYPTMLPVTLAVVRWLELGYADVDFGYAD